MVSVCQRRGSLLETPLLAIDSVGLTDDQQPLNTSLIYVATLTSNINSRRTATPSVTLTDLDRHALRQPTLQIKCRIDTEISSLCRKNRL